MSRHPRSGLSKVYYSPVEAAIRWSGLLEEEIAILQQTVSPRRLTVISADDWPTLQLNLDRLYDAMRHNELAFGRTGNTDSDRALLSRTALTIRHVDLKRWMATMYPAHKPSFLFDKAERLPHECLYQNAGGNRTADYSHHDEPELGDGVDKKVSPLRLTISAETTYLNVIGALLTLLLGHSPSGKRYSSFRSLESVIRALISHHDGRPGITQRTLWTTFAQAKRHLSAMP
ncbi:hypothetical protein JRG42_12410 [Pseudomonas granadensis]|uniref:hypothetical protein n=1 Tax=Pseudomonas granadensis TaxID=1421430 RepID=UPI0019D181BD|nr:hypothetical protein [Pseudomonas granadensis]MBN6774226.1 hypothetical protein [Pseudomonas granadensis]MBN6805300.1 hypothetical protein [Pseudomonas granadensis]MBN6832252.1 hypothetical protein [Pseudomonas granadensis]MBN6839494.1 hypothetical protein [Pseudomonas granadensis]MBN6868675.1 hypothetical protein [Pseudomonas granadensis]